MIGQPGKIRKTPAGVKLGPLDLIPNNQARNFVLEMREGHFYGFVVRKDDAVFGYVDVCPHRTVPLATKLDDYLTPKGDMIACSWHGAVFRIEDGFCLGGPCKGETLHAWPVEVVDGEILTA